MMVATPSTPVRIMATNTGNPGNVVRLPQWLTSAEAAHALGIAERTLRLRAERGQVPRQRDGRTVRYQVTPSADVGMPIATANVVSAMPATTAAPDAVVSALVQAVERATAAERDAATARAELANVRAHLDTERREVATLRAELTAAWVELDATRRGWVEALASAPRTP